MNQSVLENKKAIVNEIAELVEKSSSVVIAEYRGLTVAEIASFKRELLKSNAKMSVYKNSLVERAAEKLGHNELSQYLSGPNAIITCEDPISAAKVSAKFAKKHDCFVAKPSCRLGTPEGTRFHFCPCGRRAKIKVTTSF